MASRDTGVTRDIRAARSRTAVVFLALGLLYGSWVPRIPAVKAALHLSSGGLGIALLAPALGSLVTMAGTGALVAALGSRSTLRWALIFFAVPPTVIGVTRSLSELFLVLLVWGAGMGCLDVSLNAQAAAVQAFYDRPVMSRFHGIYSLGALVGAGLGSIAAAQRLPIDIHLGVAGLLTLVAGEWATGAMVGKSLDLAKSARRFVRPDLELVVLGILGFCALLCEGAAADWSAVYLHVTLDQSVGVAGLGYVVFSAAMIAGRLAGDRLTERLGWRLLFRLSCLFAAVGFGVALLIGTPTSVLVGFGVLGAGVACAAPLVFSAAGRHRDPGPSMASVSTGSYFGFLAGPPIIGAIAASVGLASALAVVPFCAALAALLVGASVLTQSSREAKKGFAK